MYMSRNSMTYNDAHTLTRKQMRGKQKCEVEITSGNQIPCNFYFIFIPLFYVENGSYFKVKIC